MNKNQNIILITLSLAMIIVSFQNCSKIKVHDMANLSQKADAALVQSDVGGPTGLGTDAPPIIADAPPTTIIDQSQQPLALDPREINCGGMMTFVPAISYESRKLIDSPAISIKGFAGNKNVDAENINEISNFSGDLTVVASSIGRISSFSSNNVNVNSLTINEMTSFSASKVLVAVSSLGHADCIASDLCLSAQKIGSIRDIATRLSLFGRGEGGQRATIGELSHIAGFIAVYNFEVGTVAPLSGAAIFGKFVNSHISKIENAAFEITLENSILDEVGNAAGIIHLKGNSKVLKSGPNVQIFYE